MIDTTISTSASNTYTAYTTGPCTAWHPDLPTQTITISSADLHNLDILGDKLSYSSIGSSINYYDGTPCKNYEPVKESPEEKKAREELERSIKKYTPKRIVYNNPATIVFWNDGTKTVVKCSETEIFSEYYGFLACLAKKIYGTNSGINRIIRNFADFPKKEEKSEPKKCPCMKSTPKNKKGTRKK